MNKCIALLALALCVLPQVALSGDQNYGHLQARLLRVVDGDTIVVDIPGYPDIVGRNISVRLAGCDTPELRDKRVEVRRLAVEARELVRTVLANCRVLELRNARRGKYFRIVADVNADGEDLAALLIRAGLGRPYDGGKKSW
ncbi:MAG: thermonuclease family protein [Desulfovibrio sp.]